MIAQHFVNDQVTGISDAFFSPHALPDGSAFMVAGSYAFGGGFWDCTRSGLHRWLTGTGAGASVTNRLVYANDVYGLLSGVSWNHIHGVADEFLVSGSFDWQSIANAGRTHKWRLTCGAISGLMCWVLPQLGLTCRIRSVTTQETPNGYDDGHIMFEVSHGGKWKLWDLTNGCYYTYSGIHLDRDEILEEGILNCTRVCIDGDEKRGSHVSGNLCASGFQDMTFRTPAQVDAWYSRIFQAAV